MVSCGHFDIIHIIRCRHIYLRRSYPAFPLFRHRLSHNRYTHPSSPLLIFCQTIKKNEKHESYLTSHSPYYYVILFNSYIINSRCLSSFALYRIGAIHTVPVPLNTFTRPSPLAAEPISVFVVLSTVKSRFDDQHTARFPSIFNVSF